MIVTALLALAVALVAGLVSLIPSWSVDTSTLTTTADTVAGYIGGMDAFFPMQVLGVCLGIVVGLELVLIVLRAVVFVYGLIPFKGA